MAVVYVDCGALRCSNLRSKYLPVVFGSHAHAFEQIGRAWPGRQKAPGGPDQIGAVGGDRLHRPRHHLTRQCESTGLSNRANSWGWQYLEPLCIALPAFRVKSRPAAAPSSPCCSLLPRKPRPRRAISQHGLARDRAGVGWKLPAVASLPAARSASAFANKARWSLPRGIEGVQPMMPANGSTPRQTTRVRAQQGVSAVR